MSSASQPYAGVRVVVLGATGFIGHWVSRALAARGARLALVGREATRLEAVRRACGDGVDVVVADLTDADAVRTGLATAQPAVVFNLAGYGVDSTERDAEAATALNTTLPALLAESMGQHGDPSWPGQQVVHVGSALEYGTAAGDLRETTVATPTTLYGTTKLAGTLRLHDVAARNGVRAATGRLFTVYGAGEHDGRLLPSLLAAVQGDAPIPLTAGVQQRDFTYVDDAVEGLLRLGVVTHADVGPVNIATSRLTTVRAFVETAAGVLGISPDRLGFGVMPTRAEEMHHDPVNVERLRALTGFTPAMSIADGIERTSALLRRPG